MHLNDTHLAWCDAHHDETLDLLRQMAVIPAPSHHEEKRAAFVKAWLDAQGLPGVYIDAAGNVICPMGVTADNPVCVVMAHMDVVFPDTDALPLRENADKLYAPGAGDDTANLAVLMMAAKYIAEHHPAPRTGVLLVANVCEEGLGNLKGSKQIMQDFAGRVTELISLDGGSMDRITNVAVGSHRMAVTIRAQGGHSYHCFGHTNAIVQMAELIRRLYAKEAPPRTTYNAGVIEGGTTVNSICETCRLLYEFRSEDRACLAEMADFFDATVADLRAEGVDISVEVLGIRPCTGDVDPARLAELTSRAEAILFAAAGKPVKQDAGSTDANAALALGVPAVTIGAVDSSGAHTRNEWVLKASLRPGLQVALATVLQYFE